MMNATAGVQKKVRSTYLQLRLLVEELEANRPLANGIFTGPMGHQAHELQWAEVAKKVSEHGPEKTAKQCKSSWRDLKRKVRAKNATINEGRQRTGNSASVLQLNDLELKVLSIIGPQSSVGAGEEESGLEGEEHPHVMEPARAIVPDLPTVFEVDPNVVEMAQWNETDVGIIQVENIASDDRSVLTLEKMDEDFIDKHTPIRRVGEKRQGETPTNAPKTKKQTLFGEMDDLAGRYAKIQEENNSVLTGIASSLKDMASALTERNKIEAQKKKIKVFQIKMLMLGSQGGQDNMAEELEHLLD